jgi:hypothetical protein
MCPFGCVKPQRPTDAFQEVGRDLNSPALLEPRVPRDPDPGEMRNLFPPQPWSTATRPRRQSNIPRCDSSTPIAQEISQNSAVGGAL